MIYKEKYKDNLMQQAYNNACDCLYYGYGKKWWNSCGIDENAQNEVWSQALIDMGG